jgi:hypothetical protein
MDHTAVRYWKILPVIKQEVKMERLTTAVLNKLGKVWRHTLGKLSLWPFPYTPI